jgi:hypothetical protein
MDDTYSKIFRCLPELNEVELEALAEVCQAKAEGKKKARREGLRRELIDNLQKAIRDILQNNFTLTIENTDRDCHDDYGCVVFDPDENYSFTLE